MREILDLYIKEPRGYTMPQYDKINSIMNQEEDQFTHCYYFGDHSHFE